MLVNPERPPKDWWDRCVFKVSQTSADDPAAVCGSQWHHKMSASQKRAAVRAENPVSSIWGKYRRR